MGVLPLQLKDKRRADLALDGTEVFDIIGISDKLAPHAELIMRIHRVSGTTQEVPVTTRIDQLKTAMEGKIVGQASLTGLYARTASSSSSAMSSDGTVSGTLQTEPGATLP